MIKSLDIAYHDYTKENCKNHLRLLQHYLVDDYTKENCKEKQELADMIYTIAITRRRTARNLGRNLGSLRKRRLHEGELQAPERCSSSSL